MFHLVISAVLIISTILLMSLVIILFIYFYNKKSYVFMFDISDFPPISKLNNNLLENYDNIKTEVDALKSKKVSTIVIEKGAIYNERGKEIAEEIKKQDAWTVGWDSKDDWMQYPIIYKGEVFENAKKNLPVICSYVEPIKDCFHSLFISTIKAHGEIPEHCDGGDKSKVLEKNRLTYHFNIDCPPESILSIDDVKMVQKNKNNIVFDSSYKHYVKNNSSYPRTILCAKFYITKCNK